MVSVVHMLGGPTSVVLYCINPLPKHKLIFKKKTWLVLSYHFLNLLEIQYDISFRCTTQWFEIFRCYKIITRVSPVTICHHTKLLQYCWLYFLCVHYIPGPIFLIAGSLYLLILSTYFICAPAFLPFGNHPFVQWLCIYESISVLFFSCV